MDKSLDLRGLSCPIPLIRTKEALEHVDAVTVVVDESVARENIVKFAKSQRCQVEVESSRGEYTIVIHK